MLRSALNAGLTALDGTAAWARAVVDDLAHPGQTLDGNDLDAWDPDRHSIAAYNTPTETVIAVVQDDSAALTGEAADLVFHLLVLLADAGLSLGDIRAELARREGVSGIEEKASRNAD